MPRGAKKRKALKRKMQNEAIGTSTNDNRFNGDNLNGIDEHGSQEEKECDSSLSSPGSQGNEEFGTKDQSAAQSSGMVKEDAKEISGDSDVTQGIGPKSVNAIAVETGMDYKKKFVEISSSSSYENCTHAAKNVACQDAYGNSKMEMAPAVDTSTDSNFIKQKSDENEEHPSPGLEKDNHKVVTHPRSTAETSKKVESIKESEVLVPSEEKRLLLPGPQVVQRTSWLSCCGLFDYIKVSDR